MTDKINKTLKYIGEWQKKDYTKLTKKDFAKDYTKFTEDFEYFVEKLELTHDEADDILSKLNAKIAEEKGLSKEFTQYAADFFVITIEDFKDDNENEDSRKYLIKD